MTKGERGEEFGKIVGREKEKQREERWERIRESKYNKLYKEVKEGGILEYLKKGWGKSR